MLICIINPNTTKKMTDRIEMVANKVASNGTSIVATNPKNGPESIEGYYDEVFCIPGILEEVFSNKEADAYIIGCFDDTGLDAARCLVSGPVIGIGEAAFHIASLLGHKFSVITTLRRSIPAIEQNIYKYGLDRRCASIHACELGVLELGSDAGAYGFVLFSQRRDLEPHGPTSDSVLRCSYMQLNCLKQRV